METVVGPDKQDVDLPNRAVGKDSDDACGQLNNNESDGAQNRQGDQGQQNTRIGTRKTRKNSVLGGSG